MKTRNPLLGMALFAIASHSSSLLLVLLFSLFLGVAGVISGNIQLLTLFPFVASGAAPIIVLMKYEGTIKWEQYLVAMPLRRKELVMSFYLNILIASLLGIPVIGVVCGVVYIFSPEMMGFLHIGWAAVALTLSVILLLTALLFPLASTGFGQRRESGLSVVCLVVSCMSVGFFWGTCNAQGLQNDIVSLLSLAISFITFVASFFITRDMYSKMDF